MFTKIFFFTGIRNSVPLKILTVNFLSFVKITNIVHYVHFIEIVPNFIFCNYTRWRIQTRSSCSSLCGEGIVRNTIECAQYLKSSEVQTLPNNFCAHIEPKPPETEACVGPCKSKEWIYGDWSKV